ncbi:MAG TPA: DUF5682 family protein [Acidimicrobiales bacterium]|nr:DUF5682 family protein [Acidimicrobiales bacterium]
MAVRYFGIRHHGPGSARSLDVALDAWRPDVVLIEGPPEGDELVGLAASEEMRPPVALLVHVVDKPRRAFFWPFAAFSPEWRAILHGLAAGVPVRFIDLPAAIWLAPGRRFSPAAVKGDDGEEEEPPERPRHRDPLAELAGAAGYADVERWWDDVVEHRPTPAFEAVAEAMTALREDEPAPSGREAQREATMRQHVRAAVKEGFERIAVVCGAWHVPALAASPAVPMSADAITLKGLPRVKVAATWIPWTYSRLSAASGYGAGVVSPGWYDHLFRVPDQVVARWFVKVARLLRDEDLPAPSASLIDAVRLAEALATLRGRPLAGLDELQDATRAVLCAGSDAPMALVAERLIVGRELGRVPAATPMVPLAQDVARQQRRLRLRAEPTARELDLDLRRANDLARSHLLHRLALLDVGWGRPVGVTGKAGTFHEVWHIQWQPELAVSLIEAGMWGTTVVDAATARAVDRADLATALSAVTGLLELALLAELPEAVRHVMGVLADRAALDTDVGHLMDALPALARALRYGDVRRTDASSVAAVVDGLVVRICVGLAVAASSLDDDAATAMVARVLGVHEALALLQRGDLSQRWESTVRRVADRPVHGLLAGRCTRLLLDGGALSTDESGRRMAATLSAGEDPARAAAWVEGFLSGSALILLHDRALLEVVDSWLAGVAADTFTDVLPLLRRTFATFEEAERRQIGERVRSLGEGRPGVGRPGAGAARDVAAGDDHDEDVVVERAELVLPVLTRLLGLDREPAG